MMLYAISHPAGRELFVHYYERWVRGEALTLEQLDMALTGYWLVKKGGAA